MFINPEAVQRDWRAAAEERITAGKPAPRMTAEDFRAIEQLWGYPLPKEYKDFMSTWGVVQFPDAFCGFDYVYQRGDGPRMGFATTINSTKDRKTLELNHTYLIADPENDSGDPFIPAFMLPFAGDPDQNQILLELGSDTPRIWFWEDQPDAFGQGDNTLLGFVADDLVHFINNLRPYP